MRRILISVLLALSKVALPQTIPGSDQALSPTPQPLIRVERLQPGEAACVLFQEDGTYRLEKLFRSKAEMYTGKASNYQVEQLTQILGNAHLRKLSQENVTGEIVSDTLDTLDLAIWRQRGWQTLSFNSPSSRKPYKDELDPLLRWFQNLQKSRPAAVKVEGAATRCLPAKELRLQTRQRAEPVVPPNRIEPVYLFRFQSSEFARGNVRTNCTVIFTDGIYRREERFQPFNGAKTERSYSGQINADSLAELKLVLDSSDLKNAHSDRGSEQWAADGESSVVDIPRENETQHLGFASEFNTHIHPLDQGGMSNLAYHVADQKVLDPLKSWMKHHTDKLEGGSETGKAVNDCFPTKEK